MEQGRDVGMDWDAILSPEYGSADLSYGERLLIWALRRLVMRPDVCRVVIREFTGVCGEDGGEVLATMRVFIGALGYLPRRRISIAHPGSCALTADERQILALIAAAQEGEPARLEALLCWFARLDGRDQLALAAGALARAFDANGLRLCAALPPPQPRPATRPQLRLV